MWVLRPPRFPLHHQRPVCTVCIFGRQGKYGRKLEHQNKQTNKKKRSLVRMFASFSFCAISYVLDPQTKKGCECDCVCSAHSDKAALQQENYSGLSASLRLASRRCLDMICNIRSRSSLSRNSLLRRSSRSSFLSSNSFSMRSFSNCNR